MTSLAYGERLPEARVVLSLAFSARLKLSSRLRSAFVNGRLIFFVEFTPLDTSSHPLCSAFRSGKSKRKGEKMK